MIDDTLLLTVIFTLVAFLYASVGHAGASGYLATMALLGMSPAIMKPTALLLNVVVGTIAFIQFSRSGYFSWRLLWPFALGSVPFAILGGAIVVPGSLYRVLVAVGLVVAAVRLIIVPRVHSEGALRPVRPSVAVLTGSVIGLVAGITGTGGGIYLSPLLLLCRWSNARETGGVAAAFIVLNSVAGLAGHRPDFTALPAALPLWVLGVAGGGWLGAWVGSQRAPVPVFRRMLAAVLVVAALKLVVT